MTSTPAIPSSACAGTSSRAPASPAAPNRLEELGFTDAESVSQRIVRWSDGRYRALRSTAAVSAFDAILPDLIEAIADSEAPDHALARFETLLEKLPSAINLFRLCRHSLGLRLRLGIRLGL